MRDQCIHCGTQYDDGPARCCYCGRRMSDTADDRAVGFMLLAIVALTFAGIVALAGV